MEDSEKKSKALGHDDESGFEFVLEMLDGDVTAAVNFDRLQRHPKEGYIIFEYLLCDESQFARGITPYTSHPNKYWNKNKRKFLSLWRAALDLDAKLYLVNYSKKGTAKEDEILLIEVFGMSVDGGLWKDKTKKMTREEFKTWFRKLNSECIGPVEKILGENLVYIDDYLVVHHNKNCQCIQGKIAEMDEKHINRYSNLNKCNNC